MCMPESLFIFRSGLSLSYFGKKCHCTKESGKFYLLIFVLGILLALTRVRNTALAVFVYLVYASYCCVLAIAVNAGLHFCQYLDGAKHFL